MHVCVLLSHVELFMTLWTVACQVPPSMAFSRQEYWSGLPIPAPCSSWIVVSCSVGGCKGHVENLDYPQMHGGLFGNNEFVFDIFCLHDHDTLHLKIYGDC